LLTEDIKKAAALFTAVATIVGGVYFADGRFAHKAWAVSEISAVQYRIIRGDIRDTNKEIYDIEMALSGNPSPAMKAKLEERLRQLKQQKVELEEEKSMFKKDIK